MGVRQGAPLVIGKGNGENYIASDPLALLALTQQFIYLEDDDIVDISLNYIHIYDRQGQRVDRETHTLSLNPDATERGKYKHYMKKEIMEQPKSMNACLENRITKNQRAADYFWKQNRNTFPTSGAYTLGGLWNQLSCGVGFSLLVRIIDSHSLHSGCGE